MRISQQLTVISRQSGFSKARNPKLEACFQNNDRGLAIIIVLWLLALITIIVTQFAFSMKVEMELTRNYKDQIMAYHLAIAGFHQSIMEIMDPKVESTSSPEEALVFGHWESENEAGGEGNTPVNRKKIPLGQGYFSYRIIDEEGKLDLNWLANAKQIGKRRGVLLRLLEAAAGVEDQEADEIIDSICDWVDKNDNYRLNGAEDDYYQSLDPPYHCKNGPFDTIYDLLLVKGMSPEIFYGGKSGGEDTYVGLEKNLTVWSEGRFNKFTASRVVLTAKSGSEEKADGQWEDMFDEEGKPVQKYRSTHYQIISTGYSHDGTTRRTVRAAVKTRGVGGGRPKYEIIFWNDNYLLPE